MLNVLLPLLLLFLLVVQFMAQLKKKELQEAKG